ncbi:MAG: hypothetical protein IJ680_06115, partial [Paludibacteraceae bacterium]|nr:hypothetical protein [Paludibacteraceae bacterium]
MAYALSGTDFAAMRHEGCREPISAGGQDRQAVPGSESDRICLTGFVLLLRLQRHWLRRQIEDASCLPAMDGGNPLPGLAGGDRQHER